MRERPVDFSSNQYQRPNQPWVCGLAEDGQACPAGPTAHGQCPALAECAPGRDGDRWLCNRSKLRGGPCDDGPLPDGKCARVNRCQPVRSLRSMRGRFVLASSVLTVGVLIVMLSADWRDAVINPGPLARQHAQLLKSREIGANTASSCAACHPAADANFAEWSVELATASGEPPSQSELCMKCHEETISPQHALAAHSMPAEALERITLSRLGAEPPGKPSHASISASPESGEIACATCHHEHQGEAFDIAAMSNAACQSCHQQRYESFATDHPDFGDWPYERRTRIAFDHVSHSVKHFVEKKQSFDCRACHVEDATQTVQLLTGYEAACASCHSEKIKISVGRGVPMLALPTLDVDALRDAGHDIGPWPEAATGDFDGRLPPMMKLLLAADQPAEHAMLALGPDFEFLDVDPEDEVQLAACAELARAIKKLVADLNKRGPEAIRQRLTVALRYSVSDSQISSLLAGMSADTLRSAMETWLSISDSVAAAGSEGQTSTSQVQNLDQTDSTPDPRTLNPEPSFDPAGAWFHDAATFTIYYRPAGHADPVLAGWLDALAKTPGLVEHRPLELAMLKELSKPTAQGLCASCHSIERREPASEERLLVNWRADDRSTKSRTLTKFSHGPHVLLPGMADCTACHAMNKSAGTTASYSDWNPHKFVSEFRVMSKQQCANCHTAMAAGDRCQQCHNYHVDTIETWRTR